MLHWIISLIVSVVGLKIFLYSGNRNDLIFIDEKRFVWPNGKVIFFSFFEKVQVNTIIRFGKVTNQEYRYYVIEATFSDSFVNELKEHNDRKYYIDFKYHWWYPKRIVLDIMLEKFGEYIHHQYGINTKDVQK